MIRAPFLCILPLLAACTALPSGSRIVETSTGRVAPFDAMVEELSCADVVFLGEDHDSTACHDLQQRVTEALFARRGSIAISLEMFERDAQSTIDLYLAGAIDEETFLREARPWPNYAEHYAPAVEFAKRHGIPVIASNVYRPLASRAFKDGLVAIAGDPWAARVVHCGPGEYRDRFIALMSGMEGHGADLGPEALERMYISQCVKDDTMAESIAQFIRASGPRPPLVVHWCGRFHSDYGLGTVERLKLRLPAVRVAITSCEGRRAPGNDADAAARADYVWYL